MSEGPMYAVPPKKHPIPKEDSETVKDEWDFDVTTVADCIAEKISPKQYMPIEGLSINMSWTQIIALINRKARNGKKIENTQIPANELLGIYSKLMGNQAFF